MKFARLTCGPRDGRTATASRVPFLEMSFPGINPMPRAAIHEPSVSAQAKVAA